MKKQILIAAGMLYTTIAFAQETFYSNDFSKSVTELNTSMKSIGFTSVLPEDYSKYEDIVAVIDIKDEGVDDFYTLNFYYNILPVKNVSSDGKVKYVIESGSDKRSDFTSLFRTDMDVDFEVFSSLDYKERTYRYQTVVVKIMGRNQDGMRWENDKYIPKYNYVKLSLTEIKVDLGAPDPSYTTENGLFTYEKYATGKALTKIYSDEKSDDIKVIYAYGEENSSEMTFSIYEVEPGEIKQESVDMSGGAPKASNGTSTKEMITEIKLNLKKSLIKSSCYNDARSVKLSGQSIGSTKVNRGIYEPYMLDAGKKKSNSGTKTLGSLKSIGSQFIKQNGSNDKYNRFITSPESDLKWEKKKLGDVEIDYLELDVYRYKQCASSSSNKTMKIKEGQQGETQKLVVFLFEVNGRLFIGLFTKEGIEDMNEEDLKFKDFILSSFNINS